MTEFMELLRTVGPSVTLVLFFVWRDYRREGMMSARITEIENYQRGRLENLTTASIQSLGDTSRVMKEFCAIAEQCKRFGAAR
jgi:hypothetical protein